MTVPKVPDPCCDLEPVSGTKAALLLFEMLDTNADAEEDLYLLQAVLLELFVEDSKPCQRAGSAESCQAAVGSCQGQAWERPGEDFATDLEYTNYQSRAWPGA